jgi:hypothetical protein
MLARDEKLGMLMGKRTRTMGLKFMPFAVQLRRSPTSMLVLSGMAVLMTSVLCHFGKFAKSRNWSSLGRCQLCGVLEIYYFPHILGLAVDFDFSIDFRHDCKEYQ